MHAMVTRQSQLFGKTRRQVSRDEVAVNAQLLIRAGFVEKLMAGVYGYLPLGLRVLRKVEGIVRDGMANVSGQEVFLPALQPKDLWEKTGRWKSITAMYHLRDSGDHELGLATTHEEVIAAFARESIRSYRDLPLAVYQIQTKFRDEPRPKSGLLRGREFLMKDLYSFHADAADMETYYDSVKQEYQRIFARMGLETRVVEASGGDFTPAHSHEFQVESPAGEDRLLLCDACDAAYNADVAKAEGITACPNGHGEFRVSTGIELGNIFQLGTKYSEPLGLTFLDADGKPHPVVMASYGIGPSRCVGAIAEVHHDDKGLVWPESVAPFDAHLVALGTEGTAQAATVLKVLEKTNAEVLYDDRDTSPGAKFADADLLGIPLRIVTSAKTAASETVELRHRSSGKTEHVGVAALEKRLR
jgi:prolyl-tRNA synthetase